LRWESVGGNTSEEKEKGKGKGKRKDKAAAIIDRVPAMRSGEEEFPNNGIGLDSWANVNRIHCKKKMPKESMTHSLTRRTEIANAYARLVKKAFRKFMFLGNTALFPEGFPYDRGCEITRGDRNTVKTPRGNVFEIKMWKTLPHITKQVWQLMVKDLPDATVKGRCGDLQETATAARVCRNGYSPAELRKQLKHLEGDFDKHKLLNIKSKYRNLSDTYYEGRMEEFVGPENFEE